MKPLTEHTENEFLEVVRSVFKACEQPDEKLLDKAVNDFIAISEFPAASDLIFWPGAEGLDTPEQIVRIIKEWREANGKPGFKPE